jgi:hypothetical protein
MFAISETERAARWIRFHPRMTVVKGQNDTGKSSLIKSIYRTFGAEPRHLHPQWKSARVVTSLGFSIDEARYRILRERDHYSLFDGDGRFIREFSSVTKELAPSFASLFAFRLQLSTGRAGEESGQATPAFLFLPFYIDQDGSWTENWKSFEGLGQFPGFKKDVADFHAGIRPSEFYVAKSERSDAQLKLRAVNEQLSIVVSVQSRLERDLPVAEFDLNVDAFRAELDELVDRAAILKRKEDEIRDRLVRLQNERESLLQQRSIVELALRELGRDFDYAEKLPDEVRCPTCGTIHENNFSERFKIAQDEGRAEEFLAELSHDIARVDHQIAGMEDAVADARGETQQVQELLAHRKGDIALVDVVRAEGKRELRSIMKADVGALRAEAGTFDGIIEEKSLRMEQFNDSDRRREILKYYVGAMRANLNKLNVLGLEESQYRTPERRIKESGSDQPRALLAFYFAMLETINKYSTSTFCPIVIDSPKQQDQDEANWAAMLEFIRDSQPAGSQIVLGTVDAADVELPGEELVLADKYHVLQQSEYSRIAAELARLRDARESNRDRR